MGQYLKIINPPLLAQMLGLPLIQIGRAVKKLWSSGMIQDLTLIFFVLLSAPNLFEQLTKAPFGANFPYSGPRFDALKQRQ